MEMPASLNVLPGMTTTVVVDLTESLAVEGGVFSVPVTAVASNIDGQPQIWVVDETAMTVAPRAVKVGPMLPPGVRTAPCWGLELASRWLGWGCNTDSPSGLAPPRSSGEEGKRPGGLCALAGGQAEGHKNDGKRLHDRGGSRGFLLNRVAPP